ncbi:hypothetical protein LTS18_004357 [Coniosporium uncinatum]|uniref:Uncharacterized protein n=1 Tax=Coniosporium uncinatum TaxID=93489 RepID=A0ACC3DSI1_9PEZI|nr:hypothetical protein LTS18_004357 [Coniosporium uncinatum]
MTDVPPKPSGVAVKPQVEAAQTQHVAVHTWFIKNVLNYAVDFSKLMSPRGRTGMLGVDVTVEVNGTLVRQGHDM